MATQKKALNELGQAYKDAKHSKQLIYRALLLEQGEIDKTNYWRAFRDCWQFSENVGKAPFFIVQMAKEHLNYSHSKK